MPRIVPYAQVLTTLEALGLQSRHYNGGVFGFPRDVVAQSRGWITSEDGSLTDEARRHATLVSREQLVPKLIRAWLKSCPGNLWIMPGSHWAYELTFGGKEALAELLREIGIDPQELRPLTNAAAIEFGMDEADQLSRFLDPLIGVLTQSDFAIAFSKHRVTVLIHHHAQLWWTSDSPELLSALV